MAITPERRRYKRFTAVLPLRLKRAIGELMPKAATLTTKNISRAGLCFTAPRPIESRKVVEVQVTLVGAGPQGQDIRISGKGHVVRVKALPKHGWYEIAAAFDDPPFGEKRGWYQLASLFDAPPSPSSEH